MSLKEYLNRIPEPPRTAPPVRAWTLAEGGKYYDKLLLGAEERQDIMQIHELINAACGQLGPHELTLLRDKHPSKSWHYCWGAWQLNTDGGRRTRRRKNRKSRTRRGRK